MARNGRSKNGREARGKRQTALTPKTLAFGRIGSELIQLQMMNVPRPEIDAFIQGVHAGRFGTQLTGPLPLVPGMIETRTAALEK